MLTKPFPPYSLSLCSRTYLKRKKFIHIFYIDYKQHLLYLYILNNIRTIFFIIEIELKFERILFHRSLPLNSLFTMFFFVSFEVLNQTVISWRENISICKCEFI